MPMSPRLLRPRSSGVHPEAADWRNRVIANGGTVSSATFSAVADFCRSIDATAGLRETLLRVNLFCGTGLAACLVPLYRGASRTATQLGNSTDTNANFISSDYVETGATRGLTGNGTSKWLNTGVPQNFAAGRHMSAVLQTGGNAGTYLLGAYGASGNASIFGIFTQATGNLTAFNFSDAAASGVVGNNAPTLGRSVIASSNPGAGGLQLFIDGTSIGTGTAYSTTNAGSISVFGLKRSSSAIPDQITSARLSAYTIGTNLSASRAAALNSALTTFSTALSRQVVLSPSLWKVETLQPSYHWSM